MDFNLSDLTPVNAANPGRTTFGSTYRLKRKLVKGDPKFAFSPELAEKINLSDNSLRQFNGRTGTDMEGKIILAVMPGNTGVWAKSKAGKAKGREFKNIELAKALDSVGLTDNLLDLKFLTSAENVSYYEIIAQNEESNDSAIVEDEDDAPDQAEDPAFVGDTEDDNF